MTVRAAVSSVRPATTETDLSDAARQLLPADWSERSTPGDDYTVTPIDSTILSHRVWPKVQTRTWLLREIDDLANRIELLASANSFFPDLEWSLPVTEPRAEAPVPLRVTALRAVKMLMGLLVLPEARVAELVGISRNSVRNWRRGHDAYPATVKRLLQVANLVSALEASLGKEMMLTWLEGAGTQGISRREMLTAPDGPVAVAREAGTLLLGSPASTLPPPELLGMEPDSGGVSEAAPHLYAARDRRPRPDPRR